MAGSMTLAQYSTLPANQASRNSSGTTTIYPHPGMVDTSEIAPQPTTTTTARKSLTWAPRTSSSSVSTPRDELDMLDSQVITLVLIGGPKWNFRIRQLINSSRVIVSRVFKGPAEKAGLRVNDELLCVNNVPLSDKPRSLLLADHPEQQHQLASALLSVVTGISSAPPTNTGQATTSEPPGEAPKPDSQTNGADITQQQSDANQQPHSVELSKLDFAYQLIKHSSASNKLVLTIRRFPLASIAQLHQNQVDREIAKNQNQHQSQSTSSNSNYNAGRHQSIKSDFLSNSSNQYGNLLNSRIGGRILYGGNRNTQTNNNSTSKTTRQQRNLNEINQLASSTPRQTSSSSFFSAPAKALKTHTLGGVHYAYRCCECYCDNEGK